MGVIVTEDVPLDMGLSIDKYYAALGTNEARVQKRIDTQRAYGEDGAVTESTTTEYVIEGLFQKWISKEALTNQINKYDKSSYGNYLKRIYQVL